MIRTFLEIFLVLALPIIVIYLIFKLIIKKFKTFTNELINLSFIVYIVFFLYIVWLRPSLLLEYQPNNFVPFYSIDHYINDYLSGMVPLRSVILNLIGNILITFPFGVMFSILGFSFKKSTFSAVLLPLLIEVGQYLLHLLGYGTRIIDVDDWILNFFGILLGYILMNRVLKIYNIKNKGENNGKSTYSNQYN